MNTHLHKLACIAALISAPALFATSAISQDKPVELKFAHWVPPTHPLSRIGYEPWAKSIEAASKGSIKITFYPAQQLGKAPDHYDMARDGIADITWVNPGYQAGRFPIFAAGELPFLVGSPIGGSAAIDSWYRKYAAQEMKDIKFCMAHLHQGTIHSKKAITEPSQIKGMKVRPANGSVASLVTALGGTNVQVSAPEAREALERGVAEAITFPWESVVSFKIDQAVKFHTDFKLYAATFVYAMNKGAYEKLAPAQKKVMDDHCTNEWAEKMGAWGEFENQGEEKLLKQGGHTLVKMTPDQVGAWKKAAEPVYTQWADSVTKAGGNAKVIMEELRAELTKRKSIQ